MAENRMIKSVQVKLIVLFTLSLCLLPAVVYFLPGYQTSLDTLAAPSLDHWLGTNDIGQDILTGLLIATPNTIGIAVIAALLTLLLSIGVGIFVATAGRKLSGLILRIIDILQSIPSILLILLVSVWLSPGMIALVVLLVATGWYDDVRVLRAVFLRELTRENVRYASIGGESGYYCMTVHVLPAVSPVLVGLFIQHIRRAALMTAGLGFLGITDARLVTWGSMIQDSLNYLYTDAWLWLLLPPTLVLCLFLWGCLTFGQRFERYVITEARLSV